MRIPVVCLSLTIAILGGCVPVVVHDPAPAPPPSHSGKALAKELGIPPGHLPPAGKCRIWYPGRPPGHQPRADRCEALAHRVPPNAWLISRSAEDPGRVSVYVYDAGSVVGVGVYAVATGRLIAGN